MTSSQEFALSAARKYLQSVVFVDDEIYVPVPATEVRVAVKGAALGMKVFAKPREPKIEAVVEVKDLAELTRRGRTNPSSTTPKIWLKSFARERMGLCALRAEERFFLRIRNPRFLNFANVLTSSS